jgi:hypothetical protein
MDDCFSAHTNVCDSVFLNLLQYFVILKYLCIKITWGHDYTIVFYRVKKNLGSCNLF